MINPEFASDPTTSQELPSEASTEEVEDGAAEVPVAPWREIIGQLAVPVMLATAAIALYSRNIVMETAGEAWDKQYDSLREAADKAAAESDYGKKELTDAQRETVAAFLRFGRTQRPKD